MLCLMHTFESANMRTEATPVAYRGDVDQQRSGICKSGAKCGR